MIAISTDDLETSKKFKESLKAPYHFVPDTNLLAVKAFDVKVPVFNMASRVTFVVGAGRQIVSKEEGSAALDPAGAVTACSLHPPDALKYVTGQVAADAGVPPKK